MKEILETVIKNLVSEPEAISINEIQGEQSVIFEIRVAEKDMGKVMAQLKRNKQNANFRFDKKSWS